jgi:predicted polyphosphate/ATP-dependent NAD kinase
MGEIGPEDSTAEDTRDIARAMRDAGADLLLFAGGDGTARDMLDAVGDTVPVLGIAAGVKIYSAVFAVNPGRAGDLAAAFLDGDVITHEREVLDLDEEAYRARAVSPALYGYLRVPFRRGSVQGAKTPTPPGEESAADAIARDVVERLDPAQPCILGPGTTTRAIARRLGLEKTLLGVDVLKAGVMQIADASEQQLAAAAAREPVRIVVTPIGGQGFLFGRGNPQIGPAVLRLVRREDVLVVATAAKLAALRGQPLLVDTGDASVDASLTGYLTVITGYRESSPYRVAV